MTAKQRENLQRAMGMIDAISFMVGSKPQDALVCASEIIDEVLSSEGKGCKDDE